MAHLPAYITMLWCNTVLTVSNLQICGRFVNEIINHAVDRQEYGQALRYRADFYAIRDRQSPPSRLLSRLYSLVFASPVPRGLSLTFLSDAKIGSDQCCGLLLCLTT